MTTPRIGNMKAIVLGLFLAAGLVVVGACKAKPADQTQESILKDMVAKATEGKADIDFKNGKITVKTPEGESVITSGGGTWPGDMPEEITRFEAGSISNSTNSHVSTTDTWNVYYRDVEADAVTAYIDDLKNNGWNVVLTSETPRGSLTHLQMEKLQIQLIYAPNKKTLIFIVIRDKTE